MIEEKYYDMKGRHGFLVLIGLILYGCDAGGADADDTPPGENKIVSSNVVSNHQVYTDDGFFGNMDVTGGAVYLRPGT
ncbi:MAG: hypothetical protein LBG43_05820 [Treponema sp.]|jgi:hypothetical protein|nr:hypothetical protein [Treponema sp.]